MAINAPAAFATRSPRPQGKSSCAAGHEVVFHDLYAEGFDPILADAEIPKDAELPATIARHCREVVEADAFVVVHPNWWAMPPAVLKGWLDRVFRQGVAYEFGPQGVIGKLKGKRAIVFTTSNTPREDELRLFGDPLENLWKTCVFGFCGARGFLSPQFRVDHHEHARAARRLAGGSAADRAAADEEG